MILSYRRTVLYLWVQAREALQRTFEDLPQSEKDTILRVKGKLQTREPSVAETSTPEPSSRNEVVVVESAKKQGKKRADEVTHDEVCSMPVVISYALSYNRDRTEAPSAEPQNNLKLQTPRKQPRYTSQRVCGTGERNLNPPCHVRKKSA